MRITILLSNYNTKQVIYKEHREKVKIVFDSLFFHDYTGKSIGKLERGPSPGFDIRSSARECCLYGCKWREKGENITKRTNPLILDCINELVLIWSGLRDSNPRSLGPKPSAIPNFAKPGSLNYYSGYIPEKQVGNAVSVSPLALVGELNLK